MNKWETIIVDNCETNYQVSFDGQVRNLKTGKILKGTYARNEYHTVQLTINGRPKSKMVHRLVAEAFIPNPNNYNIVDHIDRNKLNNNVNNLRWVDTQTNAKNINERKKANSFCCYDEDISLLKPLLVSDSYGASLKGEIVNLQTKKILKGVNRNGYIRVTIKGKTYSAHKLIWEAYNGLIIDSTKVIDHIDGNRSNNCLENLRLISQSRNVAHAAQLGNGSSKEVLQYDLQGNFIKKFKSYTEAGQEYGVSKEAIGQAVKRKGTCKGYVWVTPSEKENVLNIIEKINKPKVNSLGVTQYDIDGNKINHFVSIGEAARVIGCSPTTIRRGIDGKRIAKGFYWILDNSDILIQDLL